MVLLVHVVLNSKKSVGIVGLVHLQTSVYTTEANHKSYSRFIPLLGLFIK